MKHYTKHWDTHETSNIGTPGNIGTAIGKHWDTHETSETSGLMETLGHP